MLGARSGLQTLVRSRSPDAVSMHCMIHRQALCIENSFIQDVLNTAIKTSDGYSNLVARGKDFQKFMFSKKRALILALTFFSKIHSVL